MRTSRMIKWKQLPNALCANTNTNTNTNTVWWEWKYGMIKWKQGQLPNVLCANANSLQPGKHPSHRGNNMDMSNPYMVLLKSRKHLQEHFGLIGTKCCLCEERTDNNICWDKVCKICYKLSLISSVRSSCTDDGPLYIRHCCEDRRWNKCYLLSKINFNTYLGSGRSNQKI